MKRSTILLILLGTGVSAGVWFADALVDTFVFHQGSFWDVLTVSVSPQNAFDRVITAAGVLIVVVLIVILERSRRQIQRRLNTTLAINRSLVEKSVASILQVSADGSILSANPAASILTGYTHRELVGRSIHSLCAEESGNRLLMAFDTLQVGEIRADEHRLQRKDGTIIPVEIRPRLLDNGQIEALIEDITERTRANEALQASETRYRQLIEQAPNGIFVFDMQGSILEVNQRGCELLGYSMGELTGLNLADLAPAGELEAASSSKDRLHTGETVSTEQHLMHKDGTLIPVKISSRKIAEGSYQSIVHDITKRREAEKKLGASDERFRQLFESTPNAIVVVDSNGSILQTNRTIREMFGYNPQELEGQPLGILIPEYLRSGHERYFRTFVKHPRSRHMGRSKEIHGQRQDGSIFPIEIDLSYSSARGEFLAFAIITDITQHFQQEMALRASEERFRSIVEEAPIGISLADQQGRIVALNSALANMLGYEKKELIGTPFKDFTHPDDRQLENEQIAALWDKRIDNYSLEKRYIRKDSRPIWVHLRISRFPGEFSEGPISMALIEDITERREAALALEKANRAYRMISECSQALVRAVDEEELLNEICSIIVEIGGYRLAWVGVPAEDHSGRVLPVAWTTEDRSALDAAIARNQASVQESRTARAARTGQPAIARSMNPSESASLASDEVAEPSAPSIALPLRLGDQHFGMVEIEAADFTAFDDGEVMLLTELAADIAYGMGALRLQTYQRQAERHLTDSEALFRAFFDNTAVGTAILSPDGTFVEANEAVSQMFGYLPRELIGNHFSILKAEARFERLDLAFEHLMRGVWTDDGFEDQCIRKDGEMIWARIAVGTINSPRGDVQYVTTIMQDVTEAKHAEQQLALLAAELEQRVEDRTSELQKANEQLQALGEVKDAFVSNVSHELRTPITSLKLYQALLEKRPQDANLYLERIYRETRRLEVIIEDLLTLSRLEQGRVEAIPVRTDINLLLNNLAADRKIIAETRKIELTCQLESSLPTLEIDASLIGQAVSVLLTNAINYAPEGGHVKVITAYDAAANPAELAITVQDDGPGVLPDELPRLFDRFYRGHAGSKLGIPGTGLGLAIACEIISRHKGRIEAVSEGVPGKGASFTIWLPVP